MKALTYFKIYETTLLSLVPCERGNFENELKEIQECIAEIKAKDEEIERLKAELAKATKRFDAKNRESKALKKIQAKAWNKFLKDGK